MYLRTMNKATLIVIMFDHMVIIFWLTDLREKIFGS